MRRALLSVLGVALVATTLVAARPGRAEQACWTGPAVEIEDPTTTPAAGRPTFDRCEVAGSFAPLGFDAFEPTVGAAPDGSLYYAITPDTGVLLGWEASVAASPDGLEWTDIRPNAAGVATPPETNDPYTYVDPGTGRVFAFHMGPILTCSILSWTDDGGATWDTNPVGCAPTGVWDHQTMVAARPVDGVTMLGSYPNVLVQCVNAIYAAECGRSLDGGRTWQHTVPVHANSQAANGCGAQHGHLAADEAGVIYLPTSECRTGTFVYVSRDSGLTWERSTIDDEAMPFEDPTIAVDAEGTVHAVWADFDGAMRWSRSTDAATTWSDPVRITPYEVTGKLPTMVAGDGGRVAVAFVGTDDYPSGYRSEREDYFAEELEWGGFVTWTTDDGATWTTVEATGADPLMTGAVCEIDARCQHQVDFLGSTVTPDGRVFGALVDACFDCEPGQNNPGGSTGEAVVVTIPGLDLCEATCPRFPAGSGEAIDAGTPLSLPVFDDPLRFSQLGAVAPPAPWSAEAGALRRGYLLERDRFLAS